jgi:hypothetical protein
MEGSVGERVLRQAEVAAAAEPTPETPMDVVEDALAPDGNAEAKLERRRQRRKTRPHGRAR